MGNEARDLFIEQSLKTGSIHHVDYDSLSLMFGVPSDLIVSISYYLSEAAVTTTEKLNAARVIALVATMILEFNIVQANKYVPQFSLTISHIEDDEQDPSEVE